MKVVIDSGRCIVKRLPKGFFIKESLLAKTLLAFRLSGDNFQHAAHHDAGILAL